MKEPASNDILPASDPSQETSVTGMLNSTTVAAKADQLQILELQKAEKERELAELRELEHKQDQFERGRKKTLEALRKSAVILEHHASRTRNDLERTGAVRLVFRELQEQMESIHPESWTSSTLESDLTRALAQMENVRREYQRLCAQLAVLNEDAQIALLKDNGNPSLVPSSNLRFRDWVKIGFAVTLPLLALGGLLLFLLLVWSLKYTPHIGRP